MKSKVLSLVLALTVLCSIMSVSTVSYAAEKGEEILFDGSEVLQNPNKYSNVLAGNISFKDYGRDGVTGPIIQVSNTQAIGGANGEFAHFPITHNFDLNSPYTLEFEYYAKNKVNVALALGNVDIFVHFGGTGKVALTDGTNLGYVENATLTTLEWHKVAFTYNGTQYSLYVDEKLIGTFDAFKSDITGTETMKIGVYSGTIKESNAAIVAVDEIYAYQSVYEPPVVETDVITIGASASAKTVTASATFSDTYATGEYRFYLAAYDAQRNKLIGITGLDIDAAGYKELKVTFNTSNDFSAVDYAKAFVWAKDNFAPTGVKALLGSEPQ